VHQCRQLDIQAAHGHPALDEHPLGLDVEFADVIVAIVEKVPHFLERHRPLRG
jgi:hypothetical protein